MFCVYNRYTGNYSSAALTKFVRGLSAGVKLYVPTKPDASGSWCVREIWLCIYIVNKELIFPQFVFCLYVIIIYTQTHPVVPFIKLYSPSNARFSTPIAAGADVSSLPLRTAGPDSCR